MTQKTLTYADAGVSIAAAIAGVALSLFGGANRTVAIILVAIFGMATLQVYGLSVAHANDKLPREMFVEASATLLLINAIASVIGPTLAATVTAEFGMSSLFLYTATVHLCLAGFAIVRIRTVASPLHQEHFAPMPQLASMAALELDPRGEHRAAPAEAA